MTRLVAVEMMMLTILVGAFCFGNGAAQSTPDQRAHELLAKMTLDEVSSPLLPIMPSFQEVIR